MAKSKDASPVCFKLGVGESFNVDSTVVTVVRVRKGEVSVVVQAVPPEVKKGRTY
jgi:hypothetical protein